jgi:hypothetical protein
MSWTIAGKYVRASATDPDAQAYLQAVEAADGQALEFEVARAIDNFVLGCKADGIWNAIKASCILAGARTLAGALVPLVGAAPTNVGGLFVAGDYNRKTGLIRSGSQSLNTNRANNIDPQNNQHMAFYETARTIANNGRYIGANGFGVTGSTFVEFRIIQSPSTSWLAWSRHGASFSAVSSPTFSASLVGISRSSSAQFSLRASGSTTTTSVTSESSSTGNILVLNGATDARIAFYSIGESLNLAQLDARVTDLINAFDTAIPS